MCVCVYLPSMPFDEDGGQGITMGDDRRVNLKTCPSSSPLDFAFSPLPFLLSHLMALDCAAVLPSLLTALLVLSLAFSFAHTSSRVSF